MKFLVEEANSLLLGKKLRSKRKELKMTQKELASFIGVTFQQLQKYESGQSTISIMMLIKLCEVLKVGINYFIPDKCLGLSDVNTQLEDNYNETLASEDLEKKLINMFKSINDKRIKKSVLALVEAIINTETDTE
ncbi:MAG: helix-turn-helix domain-containing protein [Holosporales bacterium]|jgi:transcriptional regulator with XRE-family HTH domain|nr:helix-turn-helix domain-containing protein [Holosporales bacterium]